MMGEGGGVLVPQPLHVKPPASPLPALTASSRGGVLPKARNRTAAAAVLTSIGRVGAALLEGFTSWLDDPSSRAAAPPPRHYSPLANPLAAWRSLLVPV